jgi:hypothetical protein
MGQRRQTVNVFLQAADGSFGPSAPLVMPYAAGVFLTSTPLAVADLNHGAPDVVAVDPNGGLVTFAQAGADTTPPETTITTAPPAQSSSTVTFAFSSSEAGGGFECSWTSDHYAGGYWWPCASPLTVHRLAPMRWGLAVRAIDAAGNFDTTPATTSFVPTTPDFSASAPPNDRFANATTLNGPSGTATGDTTEAIFEQGEPGPVPRLYQSASRSVWFRWTAPADGSATFDTAGSSFRTRIGIFTGSTLTSLTPIGGANSASGNWSVDFQVTAGATYDVQIDGDVLEERAETQGGAYRLAWSFSPGQPSNNAPGNDAFSAAQTVPASGGALSGDTTSATREAGEPLIVGNPGGHSVWIAWTASVTGSATVDTEGSAFDTTLAVYTGTAVGSLTRLVENDDSGSGTTSSVSFTVTAGTTYRIQLDGYNGTSRPPWYGTYTLTVTGHPAASGGGGGGTAGPGNDGFAAAQTVAAGGGSVTGDTTAATREAGEPLIVGNPGGHSLWFAWTPTVSGTATIATAGSAFDTTLAVYTGTAVGSLTRLVENDDSGSGTSSSVSFAVVAGTTYRIQLDGYDGTSRPPWYGTYTLTVKVV